VTIHVKDINDMPPQFTKSEWFTEVDETEGMALPDAPILTVTVHDEDETNKFHYKVRFPSLGFPPPSLGDDPSTGSRPLNVLLFSSLIGS